LWSTGKTVAAAAVAAIPAFGWIAGAAKVKILVGMLGRGQSGYRIA
jgi:hypothetical protein